MAERKLANEILRGVPAIADYVGETPRQTYDLLETGRLPGFKTPGGRVWHAFKSTIDEHYKALRESIALRVVSVGGRHHAASTLVPALSSVRRS